MRAAHWMTHIDHDLRSPIWRPWLEGLGRHVTLYRYDARGCGLSGRDDVPLGVEAAVEELEVVIDAAGLDRVALLGISAGGATSIAYAAKHPERVSRLVLLGAYGHGLSHRALSNEAREYHDVLVRVLELGWGRHHPMVQQFFTTMMLPDAPAEATAALNEQQQVSCDGARAVAILRASDAIDVRPLLSTLSLPTLVLHGEDERAVPAEHGRELAAAIPGARFETLPTRNHIPLAGEPAFGRLCAAVAEFLGAGAAAPDIGVTSRDREILELVARGHDNLQIAAHLGLAEKTIRNALSRLYVRLGVEGRSQAIVRTRELGFGRD